MKKGFLMIAVFALLIYLIPALPVFFRFGKNGSAAESTASGPAPVSDSAPAVPPVPADDTNGESPLLILDERSGLVLTVPVRDYVRGAVAAEMPINFPDEALRAQAVAAHSYALAVRERCDPQDSRLKGAYFSANPAQRHGYVDETAMRAMWGDAFEENSARLDAALEPVLDQILVYNGRPALACYHAISAGRTESAADVWGGDVPYLVPVDSAADLTSPDFEQKFTVTKQELAQDLQAAFPSVVLEGDAAGWFGAPVLTPSGYVKSIAAGNLSCPGTAVRSALHLRSCAFSIRWTEDHLFEITTHGYGHGVGMSQYGANVLALTGKTCPEILAYYYPGTVMTPVSALAGPSK